MSELFQRFHLTFWFKINMINAYLAWHRDERVLAAEYENEARRFESELQRMDILRRAT